MIDKSIETKESVLKGVSLNSFSVNVVVFRDINKDSINPPIPPTPGEENYYVYGNGTPMCYSDNNLIGY